LTVTFQQRGSKYCQKTISAYRKDLLSKNIISWLNPFRDEGWFRGCKLTRWTFFLMFKLGLRLLVLS
jgi:hypothetical protein